MIETIQELIDSLNKLKVDSTLPTSRRSGDYRIGLDKAIVLASDILIENKIKLPKKLYSFVYCSCIHESANATISTHYTKEGAEIAMYIHKNEELKKFNEMFENENEFDIEFGQHERWGIEEIEVLD